MRASARPATATATCRWRRCSWQIRPAAGDPVKPSLVVKLTGFEQAVEAGSELISPSDGNLKGDSSYMAPEVGARVWDEA